MEVYVLQFVLFMLLFLRAASMIVLAPVLGHAAVPVQTKVGLGVFMALVLYPVMMGRGIHVDLALGSLAVLAMQEAVTGLAIGFASGLIFAGAQAAGELIGFDLGLSLATAFDPETGTNNVIGNFLYLAMVLVFLLLNGPQFILQALVLSYDAVPLGGLVLTAATVDQFLHMTGLIFIVGMKCAAPIVVASFLLNLALAVLARVAPQVNVFIISFPIKIAVGVMVLMAAAPILVYAFKQLLLHFEEELVLLVRTL
jgi:flagellar biosynthetic protein FliR